MSGRRFLWLSFPPLLACQRFEPAPQTYDVGRVALASEIAAWDIDVNGSGVGLPMGSGGVNDGAAYYATLCASCHGARGEGTSTAPQLVRPESTSSPVRRNIATHWPYAPPLFSYIRRAMPPERSKPLGADTLYALIAYLLNANRIALPGDHADSSTLRRVVMPSRDRFIPDDRRGGRELR